MKQAIITGFGKTDKLSFRETAMPTMGASGILVKIVAASVNPKDTFVRKGRYKILTGSKFPMGVGFDYSGIVEASNHKKYKKGDQVYGMINGWQGATFAEYLVAKNDEIMHAPANLSLPDAAAVPLAAQTALQALRDLGHLKKGFKICINGASGGVGIFAIQIAKVFDCEVTTLTSPANFDFCKSLGADFTMDYNNTDFFKKENTFDLFFDVFGNRSFQKTKHLLHKQGVYISTVPSKGLLFDYAKTIFSAKKAKLVIVKSTNEKLYWLKQHIENGAIKPVISSTFPFDRYPEAQAAVETKRTKGKVIVTITPNP
jgi:NADPH:quinone reductase-like Zn-dependent oxidoreductase